MESQIGNVRYSSVPACESHSDCDNEAILQLTTLRELVQNLEEGTSSDSCRVSRRRLVGALLCLVPAVVLLQYLWCEFDRTKRARTPVNPPTPPSGAPPVRYNFNGKKCFATNRELKDAVDSYLMDEANETLKQVYGLPIGVWCTRYLDDFSGVFAVDRNPSVTHLMKDFNDDITAWDVSSAVVLDRLFRGLEQFDQDLSQWSVSNVRSMRGVFEFTKRFNGDIRPWDVSKVTNFHTMFVEAQRFDRNLAYWNVSSAEDTAAMFRNARRFNQNLCSWGRLLRNTTTTRSMFMNSGCPTISMVGPFLGDSNSVPGPFCHPCLHSGRMVFQEFAHQELQ